MVHVFNDLNISGPIEFIDRETEVIRNETQDAVLRCEVTGDPQPTVSWVIKDTPYKEGKKRLL